MDPELIAHLRGLEGRMNKRLDTFEMRMIDRLDTFDTRSLMNFHGWASPRDLRGRSRAALLRILELEREAP